MPSAASYIRTLVYTWRLHAWGQVQHRYRQAKTSPTAANKPCKSNLNLKEVAPTHQEAQVTTGVEGAAQQGAESTICPKPGWE